MTDDLCPGCDCFTAGDDSEARDFLYAVAADPWAALMEPLPDGLDDLTALKELRPIVYAILHALRWSLDDSLGVIGRLAEIDRRIALIERTSR